MKKTEIIKVKKMPIRIFLFFIFILLADQATSQISPKHEGALKIENGIGIEVIKGDFTNPPVQYRMLQMSHQPIMDGTLDSLKKYGYGGVVSNVGFGNYLQSDKEWQLFDDYQKRCTELGLGFWLYDEKGYPSGKAGGLTLQGHPEYETIGITFSRTEGSGKISHPIPPGKRYFDDPVYICAAPVTNGLYDFTKMIDLTKGNKKGEDTLKWQTPDQQQWGILSFHLKRMYEGTHIVTNVSDTGRYINIIDREAIARFINLTHEAYKSRMGDALPKSVHAVFTDEPSLMTSYLKNEVTLLPAIPWSRTFRAEFEAKYGYDIVTSLPYLFEDGGAETVYKRLDYWSFVSGLIEENYYGQIQNWCRANGPAASGHGLLEESLYWHAVYEGNLFRDLRRMDLPGLDMLTSDPMGLARSTQIPVPKFVSSVTHMTGKWENMSETSAHQQRAAKIPVSFAMRMATVGYQYALGLTRVTSYYGYNEFTDPERKIFNDYIGRLGLLLTQGKHQADIAVYYPIQTMWGSITPTRKTTWEPPDPRRTEPVPAKATRNQGLYLTNHIIPYTPDLPDAQRVDAAFGEVSRELLASQLDFDYMDDQALSEATLQNGKLLINGEAFSCLVLPETTVIPLATYKKIAAFVSAGGSLVVLGQLPRLGLNKLETTDVILLSDQLRKSKKVKMVVMIPEIQEAVRKFVTPDLKLDRPCRELFYNHRNYDQNDSYYLINLSDQPVEREVTFRASGNIENWNPVNGQIHPVTGISRGERTNMKIRLKPFESTILLFSKMK
jgi:hypothetical protein